MKKTTNMKGCSVWCRGMTASRVISDTLQNWEFYYKMTAMARQFSAVTLPEKYTGGC
ncbi:hypothetical protein [uncultured Ruminococcus sp.]|uniref:hypothetical protein n=1 Tax=uncultured Ruminococcus sp. TaxID=165186 RepID=UPI0025EC5519|nr:hypothetical protein [uncultured Ruminococcus sp.]